MRTHEVKENNRLLQLLPAESQEMLMRPARVVFRGGLEKDYEKSILSPEAIRHVKILKEAVESWIKIHHGFDIKSDEKTCERIVYLFYAGNKKKWLLEALEGSVHSPEKVTETLFKIAAYLSQQTRAKTEDGQQSLVEVNACKCAKRKDKSEPGQCKPQGAGRQGRYCSCEGCNPFCYSNRTGWLLQANVVQKVTKILGKDPWNKEPPPVEDPTGDLGLFPDLDPDHDFPFCSKAAAAFLLGGSSAKGDSNPNDTLR